LKSPTYNIIIAPLGLLSTKDFELREALQKNDVAYYYHKQKYKWFKIIILDVVIKNDCKYIKFNITDEKDLNMIKEVEIILSVHSNMLKM